ncbi:MAG: isoprenylcysteine carboxyl methyltransferase [Sneathiella sp.]|uniref:methyltransferase family protein n=1 Tax=Sneathiella sp. TaxID=1964365 RepID=UPI000C456020|nr:isoprenylcysteine carboxylmethyltransferase family protein [Sneathiella sp.]MAZ04133.1 isoprenylcysteine carboxyl methyltransferase [Sneathiella sp.]
MAKSDSPGVKIPPPLCFLAFLAIGIYFNSAWMEGRAAEPILTVIGGLLTLVSAIYLAHSARKHKTAGSNVEPWKPTTTIISDGIYKYSRNPIYVAMAAAYLGLAIAAASWLAVVLLPFCLAFIRYYVIAKEEAYLEDKFGSEYLEYKKKVRRWL